MKAKSRRRLLLSSVAMLLVAMLALGTATFAWFSTKTTADAHTLTANTTQGTNLMISESKTTGWTQDLTFANDSTTKLDPVTPGDANFNDSTTWYKATANGWDTQAANGNYEATSKTGYVLEQIVYVKYDAVEGSFVLDVDLTVTVNGNGTDDYYRVAIVPISATTDSDLANATGATTKVYADSATVKATGATYADYASLVTTSTSNIALGTITAGSIYGYKLYIWFEGEDPDCKDSLSTNNISLALSFGGAAA